MRDRWGKWGECGVEGAVVCCNFSDSRNSPPIIGRLFFLSNSVCLKENNIRWGGIFLVFFRVLTFVYFGAILIVVKDSGNMYSPCFPRNLLVKRNSSEKEKPSTVSWSRLGHLYFMRNYGMM